MKATTNEGRQLDLKPDAFDALRARVTGPALPPGEGGYEGSRTVWNAMIDRKPVVRCLVVSCVRFAGGHDLPVCIQGEGLDPAGLAAADGALMVDRSRPSRWVDPAHAGSPRAGGMSARRRDRDRARGRRCTICGSRRGTLSTAEVCSSSGCRTSGAYHAVNERKAKGGLRISRFACRARRHSGVNPGQRLRSGSGRHIHQQGGAS